MYESKFDAFFDQSIKMLTSTDNIQIFRDKITELDKKYRDDPLIHTSFFGSMIKALHKYRVNSRIIMFMITDWD